MWPRSLKSWPASCPPQYPSIDQRSSDHPMEEVLDGFKVTVGNARLWIRCKEEILDRESSGPSSGRFWAKAECIDVIVYPHEWPHFVSHDTSHLVELPSSVHPGRAAWPGQNPQASRKTTERGHYRISIVLPRGGPDDLGGKCSDAFTHAPRQAQVKDHAESVPLVQHHLVLFEVVEAGKPGIEGECVEDAIDIEEQKGMLGINMTAGPGGVTAVIGSTGSGKTTLLNLLTRLFDATSGSVSIDGVDVRRLDAPTLSRLIGLVPQRPYQIGRAHV